MKLGNPEVVVGGEVGSATTDSLSSDVAIGSCLEHPGEELRLYCEPCGELVCYKCGLKGGKHQNHDYAELDEALEKCKEVLTSSLDPMERQVMTVTNALAELDKRCGEISDQGAATKNGIHITFNRLREVLNAREAELVDQLDQMAWCKLKNLAAQRDQIETTLAQLSSCLQFMRERLRAGDDIKLLSMKKNAVNRVEKLTTSFKPDTFMPNIEADMVFLASAEMTLTCQKYGRVRLAKNLPDPSKSYVAIRSRSALVGTQCSATLQIVDVEGKMCEEPIMSLECTLVSELTGGKGICSVERRGKSQYEISCKPTSKGKHLLHVEAEGRHIRGSPFRVAGKIPVKKLGTPILNRCWIIGKRPWGVVVNQRGEVVVTEWNGHCVTVFAPSGEKLRSFGTRGPGQGQFDHPRGVAVDDDGNIIVVDSANHRIQKFTAVGQFIAAVGTEGSRRNCLSLPADVVFNKANKKVYVVDAGNHRIQVRHSDLTFSSSFGKEGDSNGRFSFPRGIACDSTGKVYVVDRGTTESKSSQPRESS